MNNPTLLKNLRNIPDSPIPREFSFQRTWIDTFQKREVHEDYAKRIV